MSDTHQPLDDVIAALERGDHCQRACAVALHYAWIDGAHHKQWVIDQMLRILAGMVYPELVAAYNREAAEPWDVGVAP